MKNEFIGIMDDAIANVEQDRDYWAKEERDRMRTFRAKAASVDADCVFAVHSEMDAVRTATLRVREDNILLQNLSAIRAKMLAVKEEES